MGAGEGMKITVTENGPYEVEGSVPLSRKVIVTDERGDSVAWGDGEEFDVASSYKLCRCGKSNNKPFCDESHL